MEEETSEEKCKRKYLLSDEKRKSRSERMRKLHADPEFRERMRKLNADPEFKKQTSERMRKLNADPEFRERMRKLHADPEFKKQTSERMRKLHADPEFNPLAALTPEQREEYDVLVKKGGYKREEALPIIMRKIAMLHMDYLRQLAKEKGISLENPRASIAEDVSIPVGKASHEIEE